MGPPTCASGATCPTQKPWLPPEKRPSVMSATSCPKSIGNWCVSGERYHTRRFYSPCYHYKATRPTSTTHIHSDAIADDSQEYPRSEPFIL